MSINLELNESFMHLSFSHIYREYNKEVDALSKEVVGNIDGRLHFEEYIEDVIINKGVLKLF